MTTNGVSEQHCAECGANLRTDGVSSWCVSADCPASVPDGEHDLEYENYGEKQLPGARGPRLPDTM